MSESVDMSLRDLQRDYDPLICDGSWERTTAVFLHEERDVLDGLQADLQRDGQFREPVILDRDQRVILDGTHRIVAAARAGVSHIAVSFAYPETHTITVFADIHWHAVAPQSEATDEAFFTFVRSFPIHDALWAESSSMSGSLGYDGTSIAYTFPKSFSVADCEQLHQVLAERITAFMDKYQIAGSYDVGFSCDLTDYAFDGWA